MLLYNKCEDCLKLIDNDYFGCAFIRVYPLINFRIALMSYESEILQ